MSTEISKNYFGRIPTDIPEIDNERIIEARVMCETLKNAGWHKVEVGNIKDFDGNEVNAWVKECCTDKFYGYHDTWVFRSETDAAWFQLRWAQR